jgi:hypothetical protein
MVIACTLELRQTQLQAGQDLGLSRCLLSFNGLLEDRESGPAVNISWQVGSGVSAAHP